MLHIAVIGNNGGSSSEHLADTVARATGKRLLVDMENIRRFQAEQPDPVYSKKDESGGQGTGHRVSGR